MKRWIILALVGLIIGSSFGGWHAARADEDEGAPITAPQRVFTRNGVTYVKLETDTQKAIGLKTEALKPAHYRASRRAYGQVVQPSVLLGDYRQLGSARAQVAQTQAKLDASHAEYRRLEGLYRHHRNVSQKEVQGARATWLSDQAAATDADAQRSAVVGKLKARWGSTIAHWMRKDSAPLQALAAGRSRLLRLTLPLGEAPADPPQGGHVLLAGGTTAPITLISPAPTTESDLQGQTYYFLAKSDVDRLSYGLRVSALLSYGAARRGVIVPDSAVVWSQGAAWLYVQAGKTHFERRPVRTDTPVPGGWFQASGLSAGTRIVTRGAQILYSVQALANAPQGGGGEGD